MPDKPILLLPRSAPMARETTRRMMRSSLRLPGRDAQAQRLGPQLTNMLDAFVTDAPSGTSTENILVLETIGRPDNFRTAIASVPGLKWLAEIDQDEVEADAQFFERPKIGSRFFKDHLKDRVFGLDARDSKEITSALKTNGVLDADGVLQEGASDASIYAAIPEGYSEHAEQIVAAINEEKSAPLPGRMYLSLSNRQALQELKGLFDTWEQGGN